MTTTKQTENDRKKARENLYDLMSEESFISLSCNDPVIIAENHDILETLTGERKDLATAIYQIASTNQPITNESLRLHGCSEDIRLLFDKLAPITPAASSQKIIEVLRQVAAKREIATAAAKAFSESSDSKADALSLIQSQESAMVKARTILQGRKSGGKVRHVSDMAELIADLSWRTSNPCVIRGASFGFPKLEKMIGGLQPAKLYLVGARPSVGKTAFVGDITVNICSSGGGALFFTAEMSDLQIRQRFLATHCGVSPTKSDHSAFTKPELNIIRSGLDTMRKWDLWIDDTDRIDIETLCSRARHYVSTKHVTCIIVDYIQLIRGIEAKSRQSRREEVGEVSGKLKALSKELGIPVIALAQLSRTGKAFSSSSMQTEVPKPNLESLKESGDLEQDADTVILLHRDHVQNAADALAIVAKNRSGACGEVPLVFSNDTTSFKEKFIS